MRSATKLFRTGDARMQRFSKAVKKHCQISAERDACHSGPTRVLLQLLPHTLASFTMDSFVSRFSSTGPEAELRKAKADLSEDGEFEDAAWGSEAGFGSLANGVPSFGVPSVNDVSASWISKEILCAEYCDLAFRFLASAHR
jgi:hypothetical protein